jgi:phage terminase large subunit
MEIDFRNPDYEPVYKERKERLERIRANPAIVPGLKEFYRENPVQFINDWGMTFDPRNPEVGLPAVVPFIMFPKQEEFVMWVANLWLKRSDGLAEKSRDMGVSWLCVAIAVWMWSFHDGTVVGFGSRKEEYVDKIGDPKSLFWKIREYIKLLPREFRPAGFRVKDHAPHMRIVNPENGAAIVGEAGDNIGMSRRSMSILIRLMRLSPRHRIARST